MFVSLKWLAQYVDISEEIPEVLAEKITRSGIEVESVDRKGLTVEKVVVGKVLSCEKHPDADKLKVCSVDVGAGEPLQIVCGASNVGTGQLVPVALDGARLPGGMKIKKGKLRGQVSNGMICSLAELGVEAKLTPKAFATGIYQFPEGTVIGTAATSALFLDDVILELGLTPNRSDCLSMLGVAYEVAAILNRPVKMPEISYSTTKEQTSEAVAVRIETDNNPLYLAKLIRNIKIAPSPLWMQAALIASGIRPHNNVVDITNYVLLEYGQPLHAFDYDRLGSKEIVIRQAKAGEKIVTLDEAERKLTTEQMVITNGQEPIAIAGVMGGANSEVVATTTTVLLESAYFLGHSIRATSKAHGLRSEASVRFEKGVDINRVEAAIERASQLLAAYASGEVCTGTVVAKGAAIQLENSRINISLEKINDILGTSLTATTVSEILTQLQFSHQVQANEFTIDVPTRRGDIAIAEDIIEEIARLYGYDHLPVTLPKMVTKPAGLTAYQKKRRLVRTVLEGAGLSQAITYSLTSDKKATAFTDCSSAPIPLAMPMSEERSHLRMSLLPNLLEVVQYNLARQTENVAIYEIGSIFMATEGETLPIEQEQLAGAITGIWNQNLWQGERKPVDFFVAKGVLAGLLAKFGLADKVRWQQTEKDGFHPGRTAEIFLNGEVLGYLGQIHPAVAKKEDLKETYAFEISLERLLKEVVSEIAYEEIAKYPSISRDVALIVQQDVPVAEMMATFRAEGGRYLQEVSIFDLYQGEHIEDGKKSVAFSLKYLNREATLTDEEVTKIHDKACERVKEKFAAIQRK